MNELTEKEALQKAAAYCASAEHCRMEVYEKLRKWGVEDDATHRILDNLEAEKYLDEDRYCRAFVRDKFRFSKWGKLKIKEALYHKGVSSAVIRCHLNEINEEEYLAVLQEILVSKQKSVRTADGYELHTKLARFALSRGFEWKDISLCLPVSEDD